MGKKKQKDSDNHSEATLEPTNTEQAVKQNQEACNPKPGKQGFFRRFIWSWLKVPLYVCFLVASVIIIFLGLEKLAQLALGSTYLGPVYPKDFSMARRDFTMPVSHYDYDFVPGVCLEYNVVKGNRYEYANNAGFREPRPIPMAKPQDEFRIFLTGGSTVFGMGAIGEAAPAMDYYGIEYRETISHMMEMILNSSNPIPGKTIKVYNAGVWGYAYQHLVMRYMTKLRDYNPDLVVSLDGANEIPIISKLTENWNYFQEGQFHNILHEMFAYNRRGPVFLPDPVAEEQLISSDFFLVRYRSLPGIEQRPSSTQERFENGTNPMHPQTFQSRKNRDWLIEISLPWSEW